MDAAKFEELIKLLDSHKMSPQEIWDQRVSFAYGQLTAETGVSAVTLDMVKEAATKEFGPRPEDDE